MDSYWNEFLIFAAAHVFSLISPGPDFLLVVQSSMKYCRKSSLWVALGISLGEMVHVGYSLILIGWLTQNVEMFFLVLKILGAFYLAYLGIKTIKSSSKEILIGTEFLKTAESISKKEALLKGFFTNALNAKAGLFTFSFFSVLVSSTTPLHIQLLYALFIQVSTFLWFAIVAFFLTNQYARKKFCGIKHWIERICGIALLLLGVQLLAHKF